MFSQREFTLRVKGLLGEDLEDFKDFCSGLRSNKSFARGNLETSKSLNLSWGKFSYPLRVSFLGIPQAKAFPLGALEERLCSVKTLRIFRAEGFAR